MLNFNTNNEPLRSDVDIFNFTDYREYLKAYYQGMKNSRNYFSFRYFSKIAGLGGKNYFQMVMVGKRNLSLVTIAKFTQALKLSKKEGAYFEAMVLYNQAENELDKDRYFTELIALRPQTKLEGLTQDQFEYLTNSLYVTIRELSAMPEFQEDIKWIQNNLRSFAKLSEIRQALEVLKRLQLLIPDPTTGKLKHSGNTLITPEHGESLEMLNYHRQVLNQTKEALMNIPFDQRDISSMTIPIPSSLIPAIKEVIAKAREEIAHLVNRSSRDYHEVFQINVQFFPVTQTKKFKNKPENS